MKKIIIFIITLFLFQINTAQDFKFGKVSKEELEQTKHYLDTTANAAVLYRSVRINYEYSQNDGFIQMREVRERIKIYNKDGYDLATKQIQLYDKSSSKRETLSELKGYTFTLDNGKVVKSKLKSQDVFEEKINEYYSKTSFTMPNISDGCVIELVYKKESPFISIDDIVLQFNVPIDKMDLKVKIPEFFKFNTHLNPRAMFYPELSKTVSGRKEVIGSKSRDRTNTVAQTQFYRDDWEFKENVTTANLFNIPALKSEPIVRNINSYRSKLIWEYVLYQGPNGEVKDYSTSWPEVVGTIYKSESFGGQLAKSNYFEEDINALVSNVSEPLKKASLIFDFVKSKVKWNDYYGYRVQNGVKKAYKEGVGNSGDINLMLTAMLRYAGINANPVLISTSSNGIPILPTTDGFNFVVTAVELQDKVLLLDATDRYSTANVLSTNLINWQGRIIRENGSSTWVSLTPKVHSKDITALNVKINDDLTIDGKVRVMLSNQFAKNFRANYNNINEEEHIKDLEKDNGEIEVSNLDVKGSHNLSKPITYSYDYNLEDGVEEIGDKLYFSPLLFLTSNENPFKLDTRTYPIDFVYPIVTKYNVNIMIPDGYEVESMPKSIKVAYNENEGDFTCLVKQNGMMLQLAYSFSLNKTLILSLDYNQFKEFYQTMIDAQQEKIVLKKM